MSFLPLVSLVFCSLESLYGWPSGMFQLPALQLYGGGQGVLHYSMKLGQTVTW